MPVTGYEQDAYRDLTSIRKSAASIAKSLAKIADTKPTSPCSPCGCSACIDKVVLRLRGEASPTQHGESHPVPTKEGEPFHPSECSCWGGLVPCVKA